MAHKICKFYFEIKMGYIESSPCTHADNQITNILNKRNATELSEIFAITNSLEKETDAILQKITEARGIVKKNVIILHNSDCNVTNSKRLLTTYQDKYNKALEVSNRTSGIIKAKNMEIKRLWEQYRVKLKIMEMLDVKALHSFEETDVLSNSKKIKLEAQ
jgi:hypothetical protein